MRELERRVVLTAIDRRWRDHLYEMEYLKEGIGLRAMAQRDPLVEYQREGFTLFQSTMGQIKEESLGLLYNLEVQVRPAAGPEDHVHLEGGGLEEEKSVDDSNFSYTAPSEDGGTTVTVSYTHLDVYKRQASGDANRWFAEFARIAKTLQPGVDYEVDEKKRTIGVLEPGIEKVEDYLGITNLYESVNTPLISFLNNSIKARALFTRDKDYVVLNGEVLIVDEHTGRILAGRRYNEGMHQAIEAKEGVQVKAENQMLATVTLQNYFRLYEKLSGLSLIHI